MPNSSFSRRARHRVTVRGRLGVAVAGAGLAAAGLVTFGAGTASAKPVSQGQRADTGTVYTETNQVAGNEVLAYRTDPGGGLTPVGSYPTGGAGTGASPASQGGVTLGDGGRVLAVVNGGSDSVSVFLVGDAGTLQLVETVGSGGVDPISVTVNGPSVYALNAGNATTRPDIGGFDLFGGLFIHQAVSEQPLNSAASSPEQIGFTPDGRDLVVTEKGSNTIDVFPVDRFGLADPAVTTSLAANTGPYGFAFTRNGVAIVSEAAFGGLATFSVDPDGSVTQISQVPDFQLAPCWVALTGYGNQTEAFTTNAHSGTVSAYSESATGSLGLLNPDVQASPGAGDTDIAVSGSSLFIADNLGIDASGISGSGTLGPSTPLVTGLPAGTFGLAATGGHGFGF